MLKYINYIPSGFFNLSQKNILSIFEGPTLITLKGKIDRPVFISCLLHGNETSSLTILQNYLQSKEDTPLPRTLIIFIGNPQAYAKNLRHLKNQLDYNRIWQHGSSYEHLIAKEVYNYVKAQNLYVCLDFHNNTGKNPHYACVNKRKKDFVKLAQEFSDKIVYFTEPESVLSIKMASLCPSLTLECGLSGSIPGISKGTELLSSVMEEDEKWLKNKLRIKFLYQSFGTILIHPKENLNFDFDENFDGISLLSNFDEYNFKELKVGLHIGYYQEKNTLKIVNNDGLNITKEFLSLEDGKILVKQAFTASMFTKNISIAKSDCLGYLMQKIPIETFLGEPT